MLQKGLTMLALVGFFFRYLTWVFQHETSNELSHLKWKSFLPCMNERKNGNKKKGRKLVVPFKPSNCSKIYTQSQSLKARGRGRERSRRSYFPFCFMVIFSAEHLAQKDSPDHKTISPRHCRHDWGYQHQRILSRKSQNLWQDPCTFWSGTFCFRFSIC